jgi:hypothetical protein
MNAGLPIMAGASFSVLTFVAALFSASASSPVESAAVSGMATYSANNPGFNPVTATQAPNDPTRLGAIAATWHH